MEEIEVYTPISERVIRRLRVGDQVYLSGVIITARDAAHKRIIRYIQEARDLPFSLEGSALYHCGPIVRRLNGEWRVLAAGPTTSMRMEPFEAELVKMGVKVIIGKGGMGDKTKDSLRRYGSVYCAFTGGAAALAARHIESVVDVKWLDLGMPEAVWILRVKRFGPLIVSMDSHGRSLYEEVRSEAMRNLEEIFKHLNGRSES
ncbi:fumarate hydratase [Candidatus Bathyarchaeota archaeon]|nr:MAG: fumarate hydratase [Candidatus Bathyarchaeota archaeon]